MALMTGKIKRFFTAGSLHTTFGVTFCISLHISNKISLRLFSTQLDVTLLRNNDKTVCIW